ncbi:hypothetical protein QMK19_03660 [Streptomyces sp. H10-C2]|uniref:hypothetical protein n=1 Tax=unclassified Streptomyces TaxID=2593676 RepID=UPI0024BB87B2|nr:MULTISPECIES: hypothetical protein [unclassified Streptomyces]MDJ0342284.1 hypothetical protein [Streptomyces sp. PH10-H1]MDJ0368798.1 hypothetical protein [Streptomyces sp. H10-C2]
MAAIATISGTMLVPGVSRNKRLYTREVIAKAAARMQERIADPNGLPIVMRTHHAAEDDSARIIGSLAQVNIESDGRATYKADLYDTAAGRDIAALVTGKRPALKSVSIHGYWLGPTRTVEYEGESAVTAGDLEVDFVDFTASPGVLGATVDSASLLAAASSPQESLSGRTPISESMDATVQAVTEEAPRPLIRSKGGLRRAIRESAHTADRVHILQRARALGLTALIPDDWNKDGSMKETTTRLGEIREYYPDGPDGAAGFCVDAYNGPLSITLRACGIDPGDLRAITQAAMTAACDALQAMDPDMDADIDVAGAPKADGDGDAGSGESAPVQAGDALTEAHVDALRRAGTVPGTIVTPQIVNEAIALNQTTAPDPGAATATPKEAAMGEPTETAAPTRSLTDADLAALGAVFAGALKENLAPVLAAVTETAAPAAKTETAESAPDAEKAAKETKKALKESLKAMKAEIASDVAERAALVTRVRDELREELLKEYGVPSRQGYRVHESDRAPDTAEDLYADRANLLLGSIGIPAAPQTTQ